MGLCAACGVRIPGDGTLCAHHVPGSCNHWAENNRLMCDLLHRGRVPSRLPPAEREEKFFDAGSVSLVVVFAGHLQPPTMKERSSNLNNNLSVEELFR